VHGTLVLTSALALAASPLQAQRDVALNIALPAPAARRSEAPLVRSSNVLTDRRIRDLLRNGFPARLHYRLELWSTKGLFDDLKARTEWDVIVRFEPLDSVYQVARLDGDRVHHLGSFRDIQEAETALGQPFQPAISLPARRERYYYNLILEIEMLSVSDLDEVERWLRGELRPAVRGQRNPGTALTRGLRTVVARLLGGENRQYRQRSVSFVAE
jgi:hypothetical protein